LFVLIFQVLKKLSKKNQKLLKIIANELRLYCIKKFLITVKKIESIGPGHYCIALSLRNNYRKMFLMRLPPLIAIMTKYRTLMNILKLMSYAV